MKADTGMLDPEAGANAGMPDPYSSEFDPEPTYSGDQAPAGPTNAQTGHSTSFKDYTGADAADKAGRANLGYDPNDARGVRAPRAAAPTPEWMKKLNPFRKG
jgi:hypothetical protein